MSEILKPLEHRCSTLATEQDHLGALETTKTLGSLTQINWGSPGLGPSVTASQGALPVCSQQWPTLLEGPVQNETEPQRTF